MGFGESHGLLLKNERKMMMNLGDSMGVCGGREHIPQWISGGKNRADIAFFGFRIPGG
jgi:ABC-type thiamine transport system ATPase subunit